MVHVSIVNHIRAATTKVARGQKRRPRVCLGAERWLEWHSLGGFLVSVLTGPMFFMALRILEGVFLVHVLQQLYGQLGPP